MPAFLQPIARLIPLTYLADALRQVMVGGAAFAPLCVCAAVLAVWLVRVLRDRVAQVPLAVGRARRPGALPALLVDELVQRRPTARPSAGA